MLRERRHADTFARTRPHTTLYVTDGDDRFFLEQQGDCGGIDAVGLCLGDEVRQDSLDIVFISIVEGPCNISLP